MITSENLEKVPSEYLFFELCYVSNIPESYEDYDEETKRMMKSSEYQEYRIKKSKWYDEYFKTHHGITLAAIEDWDRNNGYKWRYNYTTYPVPEYAAGYTHYLYFTSNLAKQWGDDWNDAPYDCNAGEPYDDKCTVIRVPVCLDCEKYFVKLPLDYGYNCPFSVQDINAQAVAWIYLHNWKTSVRISILAGDNVQEVINKLKQIEK